MKKCHNCGNESPDNSKFCTECGSILQAQTLRLGEKLQPGVHKVVPMVRLRNSIPVSEEQDDAGGQRVRQEVELDEWKRMETELHKALEDNGKLSETLETLRHDAVEQGYLIEELRGQNKLIKSTWKIALTVALSVFLIMLIICVFAVSGNLKKGKELAEFRPYIARYDSLALYSKEITAERDSVRAKLIDISELYAQAASGKPLAAADRRRRDINIDMVPIKGGAFRMGCTAEQGKDCDEDEEPAHSVTVADFYIGKYPVTQAQWKSVMGSNPSHYRGDNLPVETVSWRDVQEFIKRLNAMTGKRYRLPTESEWEYAARGGADGRGYKYAGSSRIEEVAWYGNSSGTHAVGAKQPNESGTYDMSGNVCEWVNDRYNRYGKSEDAGQTGGDRVLRGGSWTNMARSCRVSNREAYPPGARGNYIGFRLVSQ